MNIIKEQREDIIANNNTAQQHLLDVLETLSRKTKIIHIKESLYGDIDFTPIKEQGFGLVNTIILQEGHITSISNIPPTVHTFECPKNLLFSIDELPVSLSHLNLSENYLSTIDVSKLNKLKKINITHNQILHLENLPETLEELYCDYNKIELLDLKGLSNLRIFHVSNNPITIIENLPEKIVDFQMENTPSIEFRNSVGEIPGSKQKNVLMDENQTKQKKNYIDSLKQYFQLKQEYEVANSKAKRKIYQEESNKRLAKKKILTFKPKCINCKRAVGTIFSLKNDRYTAICGDSKTPCRLNIELFHGNYSNIYYMLNIFREDIDNLKEIIIKQKMDTLFNYVSSEKSVELFKKELKLYNGDSMIYKEILDKYNSLYNNEHIKESIHKKTEHIFRLIEDNHRLLEEYKKTNQTEFLNTAVQLQINEIIPEIKNIRMLKNEVVEMNRTEVSNKTINTLFTYPVSLSKIDFINGEPESVVKFSK
jgi:hypothetical protein